jgi:HD-GYP domain-containing protein (c-di-GMP phosphodiesterase class II)
MDQGMKLPVSHLTPGMKLARPVYGLKGQMLLNRGVKLTTSFILGLRRHHILAVMIEGIIDLDERDAENILEESVRTQALASIEAWVQNNKKQRHFATVMDSVNTIVDEILAGKIPSGSLAEISTTDTYTFAHSIDVCAFSVFMGLNYGYKKTALLKLGIGSILHDLGKTKVSLEILNKPDKLTDEEMEEIKNHPVFGYNMLIDDLSEQLCDASLDIVLSHHERYNGNGYPKGIRGDEIDDMITICALADVYSAMTTDRVYRKAFPANEAYELVMTYGDRDFKMRLVRLFATCVCPYPVDTLVLLSTGEIGQVTATNRNLPFRPVVTAIESKEEVDLSKELSVVIARALTDDEARAALICHVLSK